MMRGVQIVGSAKSVDTLARGRDSRALDGALARLLDAQTPQLLDQSLSRDAEDARGAALVPRREAQHLVDVIHLDLRQRRQIQHVAHRGRGGGIPRELARGVGGGEVRRPSISGGR